MTDDDNTLAPCGACPRFVTVAELCECGDELGPFCPICHREWHTDDRAYYGGSAA